MAAAEVLKRKENIVKGTLRDGDGVAMREGKEPRRLARN